VLTIDNQTSKKKKLLYRSKTKPLSEWASRINAFVGFWTSINLEDMDGITRGPWSWCMNTRCGVLFCLNLIYFLFYKVWVWAGICCLVFNWIQCTGEDSLGLSWIDRHIWGLSVKNMKMCLPKLKDYPFLF
jgi:hypothetical protein